MTQDTLSPLNAGQQAAADGFFQFLLSDEKELSIRGPGGVGKTFLMSYLIDRVIPKYHEACQMMGVDSLYSNVVMTATTNKAAEVLAQATNRPTETIYKFMNLTVKDDYSTGDSKIVRTNLWHVRTGWVIFIDEGSMIDTALLREIRDGTMKSKIVFVSDNCQLAPVKEKLSPIYKRAMPTFELTQPVRNKDQPALMDICTQLRATVESGDFSPVQIVPGVIDWVDDEAMEKELLTHFAVQNPGARILAYTNDRVTSYNDYVRSLRNLSADFTVGELLVNNTAVQHPSGMISVEEEVEVIAMSNVTEMVEITPDVYLEVRRCDLRSDYTVHHEVPIPVDRVHHKELMKYFAGRREWRPYFNLKNIYPDLRPRDAATIHKSQGSTYDVVYIDLGDLSTKCNRADVAARLLYVAFTRARTRIVLYGELADKFGGLIQ